MTTKHADDAEVRPPRLESTGRVPAARPIGARAFGSFVFVACLGFFGCNDGQSAPPPEESGGQGGAAPSSGGAAATGGSGESTGGASLEAFMFGADISNVPEELDQGASYLDVDGSEKPILEIFSNHGFNYIRLRTFVDPQAPYGYAYGDGAAECVKAEAYCDLAHTLEFGRQIKEAGMGFLLDFHYSDNWADPGKQIIPEAWRDAESIEELADYVHDYTRDSIETLINGGARPDVVQIGNEITPGMLMHVPTSGTDCWGNGSELNELNGSIANWDNLATLLRAGIDAVEEVDPTILTMVHLENTDYSAGAMSWVQNAQARGVEFDILGLSCYPAYQGPPSTWAETLDVLAERFPDLLFVVAEYGPQPEDVIDVITSVPDGRGVGAFRWEPTRGGAWGGPMFSTSEEGYRAIEEEFSTYAQLSASIDD